MPLPQPPFDQRPFAPGRDPIAYRARWVLPVDSPPLEDGLVTVAAGRIVEVGKSTAAKQIVELGNGILLPALVNAHSHLELSSQPKPLGAARQSFPQWIGAVVAGRRKQAEQFSQEQLQELRTKAIQQGLAESESGGVAIVGDIASASWPQEPYSNSSVGGIIFEELLGLGEERIEPLLQQAITHLDAAPKLPANFHWQLGLSPHAPYTIHPELLRQVCQLSAQRQAIVALHLAESPAELELLTGHRGTLVTLLETLGAWRANSIPHGSRPLDYLKLLSTAHRALVIHGNYLISPELNYLAQQRETMSLVYCPRTQFYFHADQYPLLQGLEAGVRIAVGTDSRASNPNLSVWEELQFIRQRYASLSDTTILRWATLDAAAALGCDADFGSLKVGKVAALVVAEGAGEGANLFDRQVRRLSVLLET